MNHPDWPAFLATILADPDEDTARLVAADFLEENGDPDRAAFIRIQVAHARLDAMGLGRSLEADRLREKERMILGPLSMNRPLWAAAECPELVRWKPRGGGRDPLEAMVVEGADRLTWRRGFVESVLCPALEWFQHGRAIRRRNPIRDVILTDPDRISRDQWYVGLSSLSSLRRVNLTPDFDPALLAWLGTWLPGTDVGAIPF